jgi:predicted type IV restriction endonuclease
MTLKGKPGDIYSNRNPSHQIAFYMQHSGAEWGILTNGRTWLATVSNDEHQHNINIEVVQQAVEEHL